MPTTSIPFHETGYFSSLICKYLAQDEALKPYYNRYPEIHAFKDQMEEKGKSFSSESRVALHQSLNSQYDLISKNNLLSKKTKENINLLLEEHTFTITTGHQLNLFTGPLYFLYKIIATINLCKELKANYPNQNFVPIYWMATEDHDFDEINYFNFKKKKIEWHKDATGPVGRLSTEGLTEVYDILKEAFGPGEYARKLKDLFVNSYLENQNLAEATRCLANALFGDEGLVIIDADDRNLKKVLVPYLERELLENVCFNEVSKTIASFPDDFPVQVNPREINLFYIQDGLRERIIEDGGVFYVNETSISFTKEALLKEVNDYPERFSPNALLRPFYQEVILPNLCYIGGGGELAYWFQLKGTFKSFEVPFPMLLLRNSVLLVSEKHQKKLEKKNIDVRELFKKQNQLLTDKTIALSEIEIDFSTQIKFLKQQFKDLYELAEKTDVSFIGAVSAQERKQIKGLEYLEKRLLKAQKRKLSEKLAHIKAIQDALFPNQSLQERNTNFSTFYLQYGDELIQVLLNELQPLSDQFFVISL